MRSAGHRHRHELSAVPHHESGTMAFNFAALRSFGRAEDLELEFAATDRPTLVTALLARCDESSNAEFWWAQTVGARITALLRVLALTEADPSQLSIGLRCIEPQCGEPFEVTLPFDALPSPKVRELYLGYNQL